MNESELLFIKSLFRRPLGPLISYESQKYANFEKEFFDLLTPEEAIVPFKKAEPIKVLEPLIQYDKVEYELFEKEFFDALETPTLKTKTDKEHADVTFFPSGNYPCPLRCHHSKKNYLNFEDLVSHCVNSHSATKCTECQRVISLRAYGAHFSAMHLKEFMKESYYKYVHDQKSKWRKFYNNNPYLLMPPENK